MNTLHLNEAQLQAFALDELTDPAALGHFAVCSDCQVQVRAYQMVYGYLREAERPALDLPAEALIPELLPEMKAEDRKEAGYLYGFLLGTVALLITGLLVFWSRICWIFTGMTPLAIAIGLLLLSAVLLMHLLELYGTYKKKLSALNMG